MSAFVDEAVSVMKNYKVVDVYCAYNELSIQGIELTTGKSKEDVIDKEYTKRLKSLKDDGLDLEEAEDCVQKVPRGLVFMDETFVLVLEECEEWYDKVSENMDEATFEEWKEFHEKIWQEVA